MTPGEILDQERKAWDKRLHAARRQSDLWNLGRSLTILDLQGTRMAVGGRASDRVLALSVLGSKRFDEVGPWGERWMP